MSMMALKAPSIAESELKTNIRRSKIRDRLFALAGLMSLLFALITLLTLVVNLSLSGGPRLSYDFFMSFPSRFAAHAGILSAWVGSFCVMLTTAFCAIPVGVAAGIYLEEYAAKNWLTNLIEVNILNLAGIPSNTFRLLAV